MFADAALAERIAEQNRQFFSALVQPAKETVCPVGEPFLDLGSAIAFFAGNGSPLTQATGELTDEQIDAIQRFYRGRAESWEGVVTPFAGPAALERLIARGARIEGWENTLYRPVKEDLPPITTNPSIDIVEVGPSDRATWSDLATRGFFGEDPSPIALDLARLIERAPYTKRYIALWEGTPAGAASLTLGWGMAFFGGMATLPGFRRRGIQSALLRRRLLDCAGQTDLALIGATPGSSSQRNAERVGFRIAYTQLSVRVPAVIS